MISLANTHFRQVRIARQSETPQRAVIELHCAYDRYNVKITEIESDAGRKYSYYVFDGSRLVVGFDNAPDRPALRLKYGPGWQAHIHELTPHLHTEDKAETRLTEEMTCQDFIEWLKVHLPESEG